MLHDNFFHSVFRIIHLCCTLIFHFTIMRDMEKMAGWLRMTIIYIFSGIGGYLYSGILLPYQAEVIIFVLWIFFSFLRLIGRLYHPSLLPLPNIRHLRNERETGASDFLQRLLGR